MSSSSRGALLLGVLLVLVAARGAQHPARILAFAGSVGPDQTPLALERAMQALDDGNRVPAEVLLFGSGQALWPSVMVEPAEPSPSLVEELGRVMGQGATLGVHYRPTRLRGVDGPVTREALLASLGAMARSLDPQDTLLVLGAGHGELTPDGSGSEVLLWGADRLRVEDLTTLLDDVAPQARVALVIGHCFGGDLARIAFRGADPASPLAPRCGLFASPGDRLADGCGARRDDAPNFVELVSRALAQGDARLDLDGDGALSLVELHRHLLQTDRSINVPLLSSQSILRLHLEPAPLVQTRQIGEVLAHSSAPQAESLRLLARSLFVDDSATGGELRARLDGLGEAMQSAAAQRALLQEEQELSRQELVDRIAERWPSLLNAYRADFAATLHQAEPELAGLLDEDLAAATWYEVEQELQLLDRWQGEQELEQALLLRLVHALEEAVVLPLLEQEDPAWRHALQPVLDCEHAPLVRVRI
ncbi:MAG: hypothetical protein ABIJ09_07995 [Pseudomonadota bacterium]